MADQATTDQNVLERGDVFFFYRPQVEERTPESLVDVQRFYLVLRPSRRKKARIVTVGQKSLPLPDGNDGPSQAWAFVSTGRADMDTIRDELGSIHYETETRGEREVPAARPIGEGVYALARHEGQTELAYALELPEDRGEVQDQFHIATEARYVVSLKNPKGSTPAGLGLNPEQRAEYPTRLQERFRDRRWIGLETPDFLDYSGTELLLIAAGAELDEAAGQVAEELDINLDTHTESLDDSELVRDLRIRRNKKRIRPLVDGAWE